LTLLDHNYWNLGQARYVLDNRDGEEYAITPLFVSVTASFQLTDHDGHPCAPLQKEDYQCPSLTHLGSSRLTVIREKNQLVHK